jgi:hypothetical protein
MSEVTASRIPAGTLYTVAPLDGSNVTINTARMSRGTLKIIMNEGNSSIRDRWPIWLRTEASSASGQKAAFQVTKSLSREAPSYHVVSLNKEGMIQDVPIQKGFGSDFSSCRFTSFSKDERYVAYRWFKRPRGNPHGGAGIYDTKSQQKWEQEGALLAVWSLSGQYLVFIRHGLGGAEAPRDTDEGELQYFCKDIRQLDDPCAERIRLEQAVRLVGPWYRPLVRYSVKNRFSTFQEDRDLDPNQVAPNNRGVLLINQHNELSDSDDPEFPKMRLDLEDDPGFVIWAMQYLDASRRAPIYKPTPPLMPCSWSRDGQRIYGIWTTESSSSFQRNKDQLALSCFWVHTGELARFPVAKEVLKGAILTYVED